MVHINLDQKYSLLSDRHNWIIAEKAEKSLKYLTFHGNVADALESYFEMKSKLCNAKSIEELILFQKTLLNNLKHLLHPFHFEIEVKNKGVDDG